MADEAYEMAEKRIEQARQEEATELDLSGMGLTELPQLLDQLTQLRSLSLWNNQLTELPESLPQHTQLQSLDLGNNQLLALPEWLGQLSQLHSLDLSYNQLTALPEWLGQLTQLQSLDLGNNQLTTLPESLGQLTQLQSLNLGWNPGITEIPLVVRKMTHLEELTFSMQNLKIIPDWISELYLLKSLRIDGNKALKDLPDALGALENLETLILGLNIGYPFGQLPHCLRSLKQLRALYAAGCELESLPDWLSDLVCLKNLHFVDNRLTNIPSSLAQLEHLERLTLGNNPLFPELAAAYEQGLDAMKTYLWARTEGQTALNEAKLILVGEGEVGKTSLLGALRGDPWVEKRPTTHGVEVDIRSLILTDPDSKSNVTLNCWDFGGQNIYRQTHQLFFTAPAVYLAVWNPRRGPEQCRVDEWIKMVKHRAYDETRPDQQPRILVVASHGGPKERLDHIDEQALLDEFGDLIVGFHHVDSKPDPETGECYGLDELKAVIARTAANIPQVGRSVPLSWKILLEAIRKRSKKDAYLSYYQFEKLCNRHKVTNDLAAVYAVIFNELGHLIHYRGDETLQDTVILKPEWLSKAISFVLEDKQTKEQNGLVEHHRLHEIWHDPARPKRDRYPEKLHPIFLKLMEQFELSYQVAMPEADAPETSLVAQLVPSIRPEGWEQDWGLKPDDTERTQVCRILDAITGRTVEAEGLMYRLIVRLHRYSLGRNNYHDSRHWKNGLLLDNGFNGRAFIEEISGDIYITVRAAYPDPFLHYLCEEVKWLVDYFWKGLDGRFYIPCPTEDCKGLLGLEDMIAFKAEGMPKTRCTVCGKFHEIDPLLAAIPQKPQWQEAVAELTAGQQQILGAVDRGFDSLSAQLRTLMSQADEQFKALLTTLTDPAKDGPRLFSFEPANRSRFNPKTWTTEKFRLTLWCEHSRLPLPVLNGEGDTRGVYELELTREWVKKAAPVLRVISVTLKLVLPIAIPGTKLATDDSGFKAIEEQLDFGVTTADSLLEGSEKAGDWLVVEETSDLESTIKAVRAQGSELRELHAILKKKDPSFGGLERVQNKRREFLWVHPRYVDQY